MKKLLFTLLIFCTISFGTKAQEIKVLPTNQETARFPDGWHKFQLQGVVFDVEIISGRYTQGNVTWLDGTTYSGRLRGAFISGRGTYTWSSGSRYEGSFKRSQRHGKGSLILVNGQKWSGKWKNNKKNGKGKVFDKNGEIIKTGLWEDDQLVKK